MFIMFLYELVRTKAMVERSSLKQFLIIHSRYNGYKLCCGKVATLQYIYSQSIWMSMYQILTHIFSIISNVIS